MSLVCPWCSAKPGEACETPGGGELELAHGERIKAAAERDAAVETERRPTSVYEVESREADEKVARCGSRSYGQKDDHRAQCANLRNILFFLVNLSNRGR